MKTTLLHLLALLFVFAPKMLAQTAIVVAPDNQPVALSRQAVVVFG